MAGDAFKGAIQIVKTKKEKDEEPNSYKIKINVVVQHGKLTLEDLLLHQDIKDLPILVFSIAGAIRGGKSFLLNMMIKYLESLSSKTGEDWASGVVPIEFAWKRGTKSLTKGLWVWPKIYKLKTSDETEVGILLLDNEGLFSSDGMDGESIALSGISTAFSYLQIFNVHKLLTHQYLENTVRFFVKGMETFDATIQKYLSKNYKLMFLVRDWVCEDEHEFGLEGGLEYINSQMETGSEETKLKWKEVSKTFQDVQCVLLPHPGLVVEKPAFADSKDLSMLEPEFIEQVKLFIEHLFEPTNLKSPNLKLTGESLYNVLMKLDGKLADDSMSFMNLFTDHANCVKVGQLKDYFQSKLTDLTLSLFDLNNEITKIMERAKKELMKGKSYQQHLDDLQLEMSQKVNGKVQGILVKKYGKCLNQTSDTLASRHNTIWPTIQEEMGIFVCGKTATKEKAIRNIVQETSKIYYRLLCKEISEVFCTACDKKNLEELAGFDHKTIEEEFIQCSDFRNNDFIYPIWMMHKNELKNNISDIFLKRINKLTEIKVEWLRKAKHQQFEYFEAFNLLGKETDSCNKILKDDEGRKLLQKKLGFAMFGLPENIKSNNNTDGDEKNPKTPTKNTKKLSLESVIAKNKRPSDDLGYYDDQQKSITAVSEKIFSLSISPILFSYVFITYSKDQEDVNTPVFIVNTAENNTVYLDTNCRVYNSWESFLKSNTLPDVLCCYPINGKYDKNDDFIVVFAKTPAAKLSSKVVKTADITGTFVSVTAGVAGVAALVFTAPAVGTAAVIGGGGAALYKLVRSAMTISDKLKHKEKVTKTDIWNVASNILVTVSMGAGAAAEQFLVAATRTAQGLNGVNGFGTILVLCISEDNSNVIQIVNEIAENTLKNMFYFNATSSEDAIKIIQQALHLDDKTDTKTVLETFVQSNSIQYYVEIGGQLLVHKYVSQVVKDVITGLLKTINPSIKVVVLKYQKINELCQNKLISRQVRNENICANLLCLFTIFDSENMILKKEVLSLVNELEDEDCEPVIRDTFTSLLNSSDGWYITLIFRHFVYSVNSKIREANDFYNNVNHKPVVLRGYDSEYHPQTEVYSLIRGLLDQNEITIDITTDLNFELIKFLSKILNLLFGIISTTTSLDSKQWGCILSQISSIVIKEFEKQLDCVKNKVSEQENLKCSDLSNLFQHRDGNYGNNVLNKILDNFIFSDYICSFENKPDNTFVPAWNGVINGLFYYNSDSQWESKKDLFHSTCNINKDNYPGEYKLGKDLTCLMPSDDILPVYLVYSLKTNKYEHGFYLKVDGLMDLNTDNF